ncbi:MAG: molybdopterin molybdotransferase MoeA [Gemmatimonadota bacterium]|nr:molybdopterin molybdotransferase MoeA [Gemmatimonadota bacterium]
MPPAPSGAPAPEWLSPAEAVARVLAAVRPLPEETVPLAAARGRALVRPAVSRVDLPPWDNSAMDGFAVHEADVRGAEPAAPVRLPVSGEVPAGMFPAGPLARGTAVRVMTGAPVPEGATGVIRIEHTDGGSGDRVEIRRASDAGRNIRRAGEDLRRGAVILEAGAEVTPAAIGVLAAMGHPEACVRRRPRVALLATGDELAALEDPDALEDVLAGRRIVNSNSHALAAQVAEAGGESVPLGIARDDLADLRRRLAAAAECDVLVVSAGMSVGDHDHVKAALAELGVRRLFWRVRMRPGSPVSAGTLGERIVFGLPGNPVSAMVTFEVLVRPVLRRLAGHAAAARRSLRARAAEPIDSSPGLTHYFRVRLAAADDGIFEARLTGPQGSGILTSMARADGLAVIPEGTSRVEPGEPLTVLPLRENVP